MELRQPKPKICAELEIGETLEAFKPGPFPTEEEVLRHFYFHLWEMEKEDINEAALKTAAALLLHWAPAALPLKVKTKIKDKVKGLHEKFCKVRNLARKNRPNFPRQKAEFLVSMKARFDVSRKDALEIIAADKTLTPADREEDRLFLLAIRDNKPHSLGSLDVARVQRLQRKAAREQAALARAEAESQRNQVFLDQCVNGMKMHRNSKHDGARTGDLRIKS